MNLFQAALDRSNSHSIPPVWLMRQAGRYHSHYQALRVKHSFIDLCKKPEIACETTMGPMRDFDFDAAILFSDLLFPLEALGTGLHYDPAPRLDWHFKELSDFSRFRRLSPHESRTYMSFQADALRAIRNELPTQKGLLGFVGGPLTLFFYSASGSHRGDLESARAGLRDGRFEKFCELIIPFLRENIRLQAEAGPDCIAIMDTCAGEIPFETYRDIVLPSLKELLAELNPSTDQGLKTKLLYYSKGTEPRHFRLLTDTPLHGIGMDWHHAIAPVLDEFSDRFAVQGNFDPTLLRDLSLDPLTRALQEHWDPIRKLIPSKRKGWICGLGHGVLPQTPEANVRKFVQLSREFFA